MHDETGGLVHDREQIVFVDDLYGRVFRRELGGGSFAEFDLYLVARAQLER